jgi:hypothetical protein
LKIWDHHGIRPGFTFFDDCWNHKDITLETPPPVDCRHNGRWAALQDAERKEDNLPKFKAYVQACDFGSSRQLRVAYGSHALVAWSQGSREDSARCLSVLGTHGRQL